MTKKEVGWYDTEVEVGETYRVTMKDCCIGNTQFESKLKAIEERKVGHIESESLVFENGVVIVSPCGEQIEKTGS